MSYYFAVRGENGRSNTISSNKDFNYYVDNGAPKIELDNMEVFSEEEKVVGNIIYSKVNGTILFRIPVSDSSGVDIDSEKIYLVNNNEETELSMSASSE